MIKGFAMVHLSFLVLIKIQGNLILGHYETLVKKKMIILLFL